MSGPPVNRPGIIKTESGFPLPATPTPSLTAVHAVQAASGAKSSPAPSTASSAAPKRRPARKRKSKKIVKTHPPLTAEDKAALAAESSEEIDDVVDKGKGSETAMRKRVFGRDLRPMMYGFGDVRQPLQSTVEMVEDIVFEYISNVTQLAVRHAAKRGKLQPEDIIYVIRNEPKKLARARELLQMDRVIKKARRVYDVPDGGDDEKKKKAGGSGRSSNKDKDKEKDKDAAAGSGGDGKTR